MTIFDAPIATLNDIHRNLGLSEIPLTKSNSDGTTITSATLDLDQKTQINFRIDLSDLSAKELAFVNSLLDICSQSGTINNSELQNKMARYMSLYPVIFTIEDYRQDSEYKTLLNYKGIIPTDELDDFFRFFKEVFDEPDFQEDTILRYFNKKINELEQELINPNNFSGFVFNDLDEATLSAGNRKTSLNQKNKYKFLCEFREEFNNDPSIFIEKMKKVLSFVFRKDKLILNFVSDEQNQDKVNTKVADFANSFPSGTKQNLSGNTSFSPTYNATAKIVSGLNINFVGMRVKIRDTENKALRLNSSVSVVCELMNIYLSNEIRDKNGAYGSLVLYDDHSGNLTFLSWRDPNILKTLKTFETAIQYLMDNVTKKRLEAAKVSALKPLIEIKSESERVNSALFYSINGKSNELLKRDRASIIDMTMEDFREIAGLISLALKSQEKTIRIYGSEESIKSAKKSRFNIEIF